jgi:hypothetical protein
MRWPEVHGRHIFGEQPGRTEAAKRRDIEIFRKEINGVAPSLGDHYGRRETLRIIGRGGIA